MNSLEFTECREHPFFPPFLILKYRKCAKQAVVVMMQVDKAFFFECENVLLSVTKLFFAQYYLKQELNCTSGPPLV